MGGLMCSIFTANGLGWHDRRACPFMLIAQSKTLFVPCPSKDLARRPMWRVFVRRMVLGS